MAALQGSIQFGNGGAVGLTGAAAKTAVGIGAPANQRVKILGYGIYFDGQLNSAAPVEVMIRRATAAAIAAGTSTSVTPVPHEEELTETFQSTTYTNFTGEPTYLTGKIIKTFTVHPQLGYEYLAGLGQEIILKGGGGLGFVLTAPAGVNARGYVLFEE